MGNQTNKALRKTPGLHLNSSLSIGVNISWFVFKLFGRGYRLCCRCLSPLIGNREVELELTQDSLFGFNSSDEYWNKLLLSSFEYEPEILALLNMVRYEDVFFLDCGANWGYWSILASSEKYGRKQTYAIEAGSEAFERLVANRKLNRERFFIVKRAVYHSVGLKLKFSTDSHPSARGLNDTTDHYEEVETTTIDNILATVGTTKPVIIKLDVEGAEIAALAGAKKTLTTEALLVYEDHGSDPESKVSKYILDNETMIVYAYEKNIGFVKLQCIEDLNKRKTNRAVGYNFFACRKGGYFANILEKKHK